MIIFYLSIEFASTFKFCLFSLFLIEYLSLGLYNAIVIYAINSSILFTEYSVIEKTEKFSGMHPVSYAKLTINIKAVLYVNIPGTAQDIPSYILAFCICVLFLKLLSINLLIKDIAAVLFDTIITDKIIVKTAKQLVFRGLSLSLTFFSTIFSSILFGINPININRKIQKTITPKTPSIPEIMQLFLLNKSIILINPNIMPINIAYASHINKIEIISYFFISNTIISIKVDIIINGFRELLNVILIVVSVIKTCPNTM